VFQIAVLGEDQPGAALSAEVVLAEFPLSFAPFEIALPWAKVVAPRQRQDGLTHCRSLAAIAD
jgi:hypothetical protein